MLGRNFESHRQNLEQLKTYLPMRSTFYCPSFSSPFVNKMALSTSRVHLAASSEVFNATCMKKEVLLTSLEIMCSPSPERYLPLNERTWFGKEKKTVQMPQESSLRPKKSALFENGQFGVHGPKSLQRGFVVVSFSSFWLEGSRRKP